MDAVALEAQVKAEQAARKSLDLTRKQYELGAVSYPFLLNAQQQYQVVYINLVQAQSARFADTAALFVALGGGWWPDRSDRKDTSQLSQE
jgi:outer membrane protein TolC